MRQPRHENRALVGLWLHGCTVFNIFLNPEFVQHLHRRLNACYWAGWTPPNGRKRVRQDVWMQRSAEGGPKWLGSNGRAS